MEISLFSSPVAYSLVKKDSMEVMNDNLKSTNQHHFDLRVWRVRHQLLAWE